MSSASWSHPAFGPIGDLVRRRSGLAFLLERPAELEAGIRRAMEHARIHDPDEYLARLQDSDRVLDALLDEVTIGETYFFREPEHFRQIRQRVLPPLIQGEAATRPIRAWSAGCATGEEAWSLAFVLAQEGLASRTRVLGTDVSRRALAAAQRGVYRPWALRACDQNQRFAFFAARGADYEVLPRFRDLATFRYLNLAVDAFPSLANGTWGLDLILCRNVLIYFDRETTQRVLSHFYEALSEGGWLILGSSDPMATGFAPFEPVITEAGVFYRRRPEVAYVARSAPAPVKAPAASSPRAGVPRAEHRPPPASTPSTPPAAPVDEARAALAVGDYARCLELTARHPTDRNAALLGLRAKAAVSGAAAALVDASALVERFPLDAEGHYVHAALLAQAGLDDAAEVALRRVLYLDRTLAVAHVVLASLLARRGDGVGARRAWENARVSCAALAPETPLPLADGETAGALAEAAAAQLALLDRSEEATV